MSLSTDEKMWRTIGDRVCYLTKGKEDIVGDLCRTGVSLEAQRISVPTQEVFPTSGSSTTQHTINAVVEFFKDIPAEQIFEEQYSVLLRSAAGDSPHVYLTSIQGLPFLTFANSHMIQVPLGVQPYSRMLQKSSLMERVIASTKMDTLARDEEDWYEESPIVALSVAIQATYASSRNIGYLVRDLEDALDSGFLKSLSASSDYYKRYELGSPQFSWSPNLGQ